MIYDKRSYIKMLVRFVLVKLYFSRLRGAIKNTRSSRLANTKKYSLVINRYGRKRYFNMFYVRFDGHNRREYGEILSL